MHSDPQTSLSLLARARTGDGDAWGRIVEIYGPLVYEQCRRRGFQDHDANDITQEIFLAVAKGLDDFRRDRPGDSFLHWLRTIASRRIVDWIRRNSKSAHAIGGSTAQKWFTERPDQVDLDWNPDELKRLAFQRAVRLMQSDFQERTWRAFWMSVVEQKETGAISEALGMSPGAIRQARSKVRQHLSAELEDMLDLSVGDPADDEPPEGESRPNS